MSVIQDNIKRLVYSAREDVTVRQMCKEMGVNRTQFYKYYTGRVESISSDAIVKICKYFKCSADWLLGLEEC